MDYKRLQQLNTRNAATARAMGNRKMEQAYINLANWNKQLAEKETKSPVQPAKQ